MRSMRTPLNGLPSFFESLVIPAACVSCLRSCKARLTLGLSLKPYALASRLFHIICAICANYAWFVHARTANKSSTAWMMTISSPSSDKWWNMFTMPKARWQIALPSVCLLLFFSLSLHVAADWLSFNLPIVKLCGACLAPCDSPTPAGECSLDVDTEVADLNQTTPISVWATLQTVQISPRLQLRSRTFPPLTPPP